MHGVNLPQRQHTQYAQKQKRDHLKYQPLALLHSSSARVCTQPHIQPLLAQLSLNPMQQKPSSTATCTAYKPQAHVC
jgi:hypothetical protein